MKRPNHALLHRDYTRLGAVHLQWHEDRIEIGNPGGFPEGVRLDNLLVTQPRPRNPLLADAFKRAGIVERTARGIDTIFYEQLRNGRPVPSYGRSNESGVVLVLPGGKANLEFARIVAEESQSGRPLALDDLLLLNHLWLERRLTTAEAATLIQKPDAEARSRLQRLVESGLAESRGERKGRTWHLSAAAYRRSGSKAAYVRQRGFEPLQQEQMVLQYVGKHGKITRREAAELCQLGSLQARNLLARLVSQGKLAMRGTKRGAFVRSSRPKIWTSPKQIWTGPISRPKGQNLRLVADPLASHIPRSSNHLQCPEHRHYFSLCWLVPRATAARTRARRY